MKGTIRRMSNRDGHTEVAYDTETGVVAEAEALLADAAASRAALFDGETKEKIGDARDIQDRGKGRDVLEEHSDVMVVQPIAGG